MLQREYWYERPIRVLCNKVDGRRIVGELRLKNSDLLDSNVVNIVDDAFVCVEDGDSLHGISEAGRVSLLDCTQGGVLDSTGRSDFTIYHGDISFRYALFGNQHIDINTNCIRGIQFTLEGIESHVFTRDRFEKFGHLLDPNEEILDAIARNRPDFLKGEFVRGKAMVSCFTGDWAFLPRFKTVLGNIQVGRSMQIGLLEQNTEYTPRVIVDFDDDPTTLNGAWEKMRDIRQFFAWMMGYAPGWKDVQVITSRLDDEGLPQDKDGYLDAFGPNEWKPVLEDTSRFGSLIDASRNPDHFMEVMGNWLKRNGDDKRRSANARFFSSFQGASSRFLEDRIISAANTFDLLPKEDKPQAQPLPGGIAKVLESARNEIKRQSCSDTQREDVLNALGRIRTNQRLRSIVEHRAEIVEGRFGTEALKDLKKVIRSAVKCRNFYTHGGDDRAPSDTKYKDPAAMLFLSNTLEFIYGASELLLCEWDPANSVADAWHPLGGYVKSYDYMCSTVLRLRS